MEFLVPVQLEVCLKDLNSKPAPAPPPQKKKEIILHSEAFYEFFNYSPGPENNASPALLW